MVSGGVTTCYVGGYYEYTSASTTRKYYYFAGQRVAVYDGSAAHWLFGDHLGSTNVSYRISNGTTATQRYYVWGAIRSTSGTLPTDYAFTGQRLDASGLLDYNARWYDPALARFISADSIVPQPGNPQSLSRYSYVLNCPVRYMDPTGHMVDPLEGEEHPYSYKERALARAMWGEQKGTWPREERMAAVGYVALNRLKSPDFAYQRSDLNDLIGILSYPSQFKGYGETDPEPGEIEYEDWPLALRAARQVLRGKAEDVTKGFCYEGDLFWESGNAAYEDILWLSSHSEGFQYVLIPDPTDAQQEGWRGKLMVIANQFYRRERWAQ